jgi:hypothetical protein
MRARRAPITLKRSLLVAACVLAIASATIQPAATHTAKPADAGTRSALASIIPQPARPRRIPPAPPRTIATTVARAYARYLANRLRAQQLPALTPQAVMTTLESGPLPARLRVTQVRLTSLTGAGNSWHATYAIIDAGARQTAGAQFVHAAADGRWKVDELIPPDPDTLITPPQPAAPRSGPRAARRAALGFTQSYLAYTYGQAGAGQLRDLIPTLRAAIAANPPRVPAAIRALHPRIASIALTRDHTRWLSNTNVTDGQNTYQVTSVLARIRGHWLVIALRSTG